MSGNWGRNPERERKPRTVQQMFPAAFRNCPHHDAPLVCGEPGCGWPLDSIPKGHGSAEFGAGHDPRPAHRLPPVCGYPGCDGSKPLPGFEGWHFGGTENDHRYQPVERIVECTS